MFKVYAIFLAFLILSCGKNMSAKSDAHFFGSKKEKTKSTQADNLRTAMLDENVGNSEEAKKFNQIISSTPPFKGKLVGVGFVGKVDGRLWLGEDEEEISLHPGFVPPFALRTFYRDLNKAIKVIERGQGEGYFRKEVESGEN